MLLKIKPGVFISQASGPGPDYIPRSLKCPRLTSIGVKWKGKFLAFVQLGHTKGPRSVRVFYYKLLCYLMMIFEACYLLNLPIPYTYIVLRCSSFLAHCRHARNTILFQTPPCNTAPSPGVLNSPIPGKHIPPGNLQTNQVKVLMVDLKRSPNKMCISVLSQSKQTVLQAVILECSCLGEYHEIIKK